MARTKTKTREEGMEPLEASLPSDAVLGRGLPEAADRHLRLAARAYSDGHVAESHLWRAYSLAPGHAAVLIGLYRFYFYKNRLNDALRVAVLCLKRAALDNGLSADWRQVRPADAEFGNFEAVLPRFFLFSLKAYAYLNLRLGHLEEASAAISKLLDLDPTDKIGAKVLVDVIDRMGESDEF